MQPADSSCSRHLSSSLGNGLSFVHRVSYLQEAFFQLPLPLMKGFCLDTFFEELQRVLTCTINTNQGLPIKILHGGFSEYVEFPDLFLLQAIA